MEGGVDFHEDEEEEGASHCAERKTVTDEWRLCSGCSPAMRSEI